MVKSEFRQRVYEFVKKVPMGKVVSYGQVAWALGYANAARQVGQAMKQCPKDVPAHRVVRANGSIAGPDAEIRKLALQSEGVVFQVNGRLNMRHYVWRETGT